MNTLRITAIFCPALAILTICPQPVWSALPIDLEVATLPGTPISAPQEWARLLGRMDLASVRLRSVRGGEQPKLEEKKIGGGTRYHLLAILNRNNQLVLPQRRFRVGERQAMQKYFEQLPAQAAYHAEERGRFGLTEKQFRRIYAELSQPVGFSTQAKSANEVAARLVASLTVPVVSSANQRTKSSQPITSELQNFSTGTALAYVLRCAGLALQPEQLPGEKLQFSIVSSESSPETWPVGWKPAVSSRKSAPQLYKARTIEIAGLTLHQALNALQPALKLPVIRDDWILEQRQIDPDKIQVSVAKKRMSLKSAVGKILSQARLAEEVRVDEQEQPFLWVTRFGKDSPSATK